MVNEFQRGTRKEGREKQPRSLELFPEQKRKNHEKRI